MLGRDVLISWVRNIPWSSQKTKDFRREIIWDFFSSIWDFFTIFCQASRYRARFQASSGHSDSANRPGHEAGAKLQLSFILATRQVATIGLFPLRNWKQTLSSLLHPSYAKNTMISSVFLMRNVVMQFVGNGLLLNTLVTCVYHLLKLPQSMERKWKI